MTTKNTAMMFHRFAATYALVLALVAFTTGCSQGEAPKQDQQPAAAATEQPAGATAAAALQAATAATTQSASDAVSPPPIAAPTQQQGAPVTELKTEDTKVGTGDEAVTGKSVTVHYTGWLTDGTKFDSSKDHGQPFTFQLGAGQVIKGWDQGVVGMKVGGVRKLTIPSSLAYGDRGAGGVIPPGATLVFEVELLAVN
jgi:FKBP-type peptidyl-prolyl cis-trans isomerase FkpA